MYIPRHLLLVIIIAQLLRLSAVGQEAAFHDYNRFSRLFQKIIAVVGLRHPVVFRIQILYHPVLYRFRQLLPLNAAVIVKNLRPVHVLLPIAVLMNAYRELRLGFFNNLDTLLHILHFFIGSVFVV